MQLTIRPIFVRLTGLLRARPYLRLFAITRVLPQSVLIISSIILISRISPIGLIDTGSRPGIKRGAKPAREAIEQDLAKHKAQSELELGFCKIQFAAAQSDSLYQYSTIQIARTYPWGIGILLLLFFLSSLAVVFGTAYYWAFVTLDVFGESEDKNWPTKSIHQITRETNMWIMLVVPLITMIATVITRPVTPVITGSLIIATIVVIGIIYFSFRLLFTFTARILESNNLLEATKRSWYLTHHHFWRIVGVTVVCGSTAWLALLLLKLFGLDAIDIVSSPEALITRFSYTIFGGWDLDVWVVIIFALAGELVAAAILPIITTLLYIDCTREETWEEWMSSDELKEPL